MKNSISAIILLLVFVLFTACYNKTDRPVGPAIWIDLSEEEGINLNNYVIVDTIMELTFTGIGNKDGFVGEWNISGGSSAPSAPALNPTGRYLMLKYDNIQPSGLYFWVTWSRSYVTNLYDMQGEDELLAFQFKARCSNDGYYVPQKIQLQFSLDFTYFGITQQQYWDKCGQCYYTVENYLPSDSWVDITIFLNDLVRSSWSLSEGPPYSEITVEKWMQHITDITLSVPESILTAGMNGCLFIDDFKIVLYRHKKLLDPTQY